jgi:hypothetical protein
VWSLEKKRHKTHFLNIKKRQKTHKTCSFLIAFFFHNSNNLKLMVTISNYPFLLFYVIDHYEYLSPSWSQSYVFNGIVQEQNAFSIETSQLCIYLGLSTYNRSVLCRPIGVYSDQIITRFHRKIYVSILCW